MLLTLHRLEWRRSHWAPVSMAWLMFGGAAALFSWLGRSRGWPRKTTGALVLTAGLSNTAFVGYPLLRLLHGEAAIPYAVLADQPGSFLAVSTIGVALAAYFSESRPSWGRIGRRLARFPPLWALFLAFALRPWPYPAAVEAVLRLGMKALAPLAIAVVLLQLRWPRPSSEEWARLRWGVVYKLLLAPAGMTALLLATGQRGLEARVTVLEAAMGTMITGAIVADDHGLDPGLCSLMVSLTVPLSLLSVPLWDRLLAGLIG